MENLKPADVVAGRRAVADKRAVAGTRLPTDQTEGPVATGDLPKRVLIIGAGEAACNLAKEVQQHGNYEVVGFVDSDRELARSRNLRLLGSPDDIEAIICEHQIDEVLVVYYQSWLGNLIRDSRTFRRAVDIRLVPSVYESMICRLTFEHLHDAPVVSVKVRKHCRFMLAAKRCFDVILSLLILVLSVPVFVLTAATVKLSSPGPVIFRQVRVGYKGRPFGVLKFRTMVRDAERLTGPVLATVDDPRITKVGAFLRRTKLDELPQLINVLKGEMSFVGPRPERPEFVRVFEQSIPGYAERHNVKPGITGLAQVQGYYQTDVHTKLRHDLIYINHMSLPLDTKIIWHTVKIIFMDRNG